MSKFSNAMEGSILAWQVQVKDVLIQSGLHKPLREKPVSSGESRSTSKSEEGWDDLDLRAASTIRLCVEKMFL